MKQKPGEGKGGGGSRGRPTSSIGTASGVEGKVGYQEDSGAGERCFKRRGSRRNGGFERRGGGRGEDEKLKGVGESFFLGEKDINRLKGRRVMYSPRDGRQLRKISIVIPTTCVCMCE